MPRNFEQSFLEEVKKRKQKNKQRLNLTLRMLLLIVATAIGFAYLLHQPNISFIKANTSINPTTILLIIFGLVLIFSLVVYFMKQRTTRHSVWEFFTRIKQIKLKYLLGYTILLIALIYQSNQSFMNSVNDFLTSLLYQPSPHVLNSPWPWKDDQKIHPIVANMPLSVETTIESVAKYIAQKEPDSYLRIKALHDYVISRITYDLKVLKTGIRPNQDAETVFQTHKGVCEGYANLFMALGQAIGENVVYIRGNIRRDLAPIDLIPETWRLLHSNYDWTLHAWNAVKVSNNWQLVDTTWDDNDSSKYSSSYLMLPPKAMIMSHLPEDSHWQLSHTYIEQNAFDKKPILTPDFFAEGWELISPIEYENNVNKSALIQIKKIVNTQKILVAIFTESRKTDSSVWNFPTGDSLEKNKSPQRKQDFNKCHQENVGEEIQISCQFTKPGDYQVFIFSMEQKINLIGELKYHVLN